MIVDMAELLQILKAMGDRNRLRILLMLQHRDGCCACEIQDILGVGQSTTSWHLKTLEVVGLIRAVRDGKWTNYQLDSGAGEAVRALLEAVCRQVAQDAQIRDDRRRLEDVDRHVLQGPGQEAAACPAPADLRRFQEGKEKKFMDIKVLGPGCANCENLAKAVMDVVAELNIAANVEKVKSLDEIRRYAIFGTPGLVINETVVSAGRVPSRTELRNLIIKASGADQGKS